MKMADMATYDRIGRGKNIRGSFAYDETESFRDMVFDAVMSNINENYPTISKRLEREYSFIPF